MTKPQVKRLILICGLVLVFTPALQAQQSFSYSALWTNFVVQAKVATKWTLVNELHYRRIQGLSKPMQVVVRPAAHFQPTHWLKLGLGYTHLLHYPFLDGLHNALVREHNVWQQINTKHPINQSLAIRSRSRFEERFRTPIGMEDYEYQGRLRLKVLVDFHLNPEQKQSITPFYELFVVNRTGLTVNQNRLGCDFNSYLMPKLKWSVGYMYFHRTHANGSTERHHMLRLKMVWQLSFLPS